MNIELQTNLLSKHVDTDVFNCDFSEMYEDQSEKDKGIDSIEQNSISLRTSKSSNTQKVRTDEAPFEFKARANSDVVTILSSTIIYGIFKEVTRTPYNKHWSRNTRVMLFINSSVS